LLYFGENMNEQEIEQALARLDSVVAATNLPRVQHLQLVRDVQAVQQCIGQSFKQQEPGDGRADQ